MTTYIDYQHISTNLGRYQKMTASDPAVAQATKYYQANIGNVTSAEQFVNNPRLFNYAMNAFGLGDMTYAKKMIQKALEQGTTDSKALANTLNNPKIKALVKTFDFSTYGAATTSQANANQGVVDKYVMQTLETNQGKTSPGVQLALYFREHAANITGAYSILADTNLLKVVQTTMGISSNTSVQNVDVQAARLNKMLTYSDFKDPAKVEKFLQRFTAQYDFNASSSSASALGASGSLMSASLLMSLQKFKPGGF